MSVQTGERRWSSLPAEERQGSSGLSTWRDSTSTRIWSCSRHVGLPEAWSSMERACWGSPHPFCRQGLGPSLPRGGASVIAVPSSSSMRSTRSWPRAIGRQCTARRQAGNGASGQARGRVGRLHARGRPVDPHSASATAADDRALLGCGSDGAARADGLCGQKTEEEWPETRTPPEMTPGAFFRTTSDLLAVA